MVVPHPLAANPVKGQLAAEVTMFEVESMFVMETPMDTPFPLWMEVAFRDKVSSRLALVGMLPLSPVLPVVDAVVVTVVVLIDVLVIVPVIVIKAGLVVVVVTVTCDDGFAGIVTVEVKRDVEVCVYAEVEVWVIVTAPLLL